MLEEDSKKKTNTYLKFTSIGIQMAVLVTFAALGGRWLDEKQGNNTPVWTIVLTLLSIFASLFQIIREVIKMGKDND
jgi:F0F1-type ATP synthase assembly protein I